MPARRVLAPAGLAFALLLAACGEAKEPVEVSGGSGGGPAKPTTGRLAPLPTVPPAPPAPGPGLSAGSSVGDAVKARLVAFFEVVKAGGGAAAAPFVVYRGDDQARRWKSVSNYAVEDEQGQVDRLVKRTKRLLVLGDPVFGSFHTERESEGTWLAWEIHFGAGESAKKAMYACLDVGGTYAVGDID